LYPALGGVHLVEADLAVVVVINEDAFGVQDGGRSCPTNEEGDKW
jgi:hypothetical protein